jgi:hypothetical protein
MRAIGVFLLCCLAGPAVAITNAHPKPIRAQADSLFAAGDWTRAAVLYKTIVKKEPNLAVVWNNLGVCYHQTKKYAQAIESFQHSLSSQPDSAAQIFTQVALARAYAMNQQPDKAYPQLEAAISSGYAQAHELETQADLEVLRKENRYTALIQRATENAFPCMKNTQARAFDFWIGDWTAYVTGTEKIAGYSKIERGSGGCLILEHWTSAGKTPFTGNSMNYIDPITGKWKQVWVGSNATTPSEFLNGEYKDGALRFDFEEINPQGQKQKVHFFFYNQTPDQVRQFHESSTDGGETWTVNYDFTYRRQRL